MGRRIHTAVVDSSGSNVLFLSARRCRSRIIRSYARPAGSRRSATRSPPRCRKAGPNDPLPYGFSRNNRGHFIGSGRTIAQIASLLAPVAAAPDAAPADPDAPSFSTALQELLGLKLETARGPGEVVVNKIERPTLD